MTVEMISNAEIDENYDFFRVEVELNSIKKIIMEKDPLKSPRIYVVTHYS